MHDVLLSDSQSGQEVRAPCFLRKENHRKRMRKAKHNTEKMCLEVCEGLKPRSSEAIEDVYSLVLGRGISGSLELN